MKITSFTRDNVEKENNADLFFLPSSINDKIIIYYPTKKNCFTCTHKMFKFIVVNDARDSFTVGDLICECEFFFCFINRKFTTSIPLLYVYYATHLFSEG